MTFDELRRADYRYKTVALFYTLACAPCERLKPKLREICEKLGVRLEEFNTASEMPAARELGIRAAPTVVVVSRGGESVIAFSGFVPDIEQRLIAAGIPKP